MSSAPGLDDLSTLRAVWERAADAMALSDPQGIVLAVNPAYCRLYGFTADQLIGRSFALIFPEEARAEAEVRYREVFERGQAETHESRVRSIDQVDLVVEARASFIERNGQRAAMLSTIRDITAYRRAEAERDAFVASASHDVRQPLSLIRARAELLLRRLGDGVPLDVLERDLRAIAASVEDVSDQIASMVDTVRLGAGQPVLIEAQPVEWTAWLRAIVANHQANTSRHELRLELAMPPVDVRMDEVRMRRVLGNLLSNAMKFTPQGGEILIRSTAEMPLRLAGRVVLEISDHGVGIPASDLPHVFEPYHRAANVIGSVPGSGLGLAGALAIVRQHGGSLEVESEESRGATFRLSLPLEAPDTPASAGPAVQPV